MGPNSYDRENSADDTHVKKLAPPKPYLPKRRFTQRAK